MPGGGQDLAPRTYHLVHFTCVSCLLCRVLHHLIIPEGDEHTCLPCIKEKRRTPPHLQIQMSKVDLRRDLGTLENLFVVGGIHCQDVQTTPFLESKAPN